MRLWIDIETIPKPIEYWHPDELAEWRAKERKETEEEAWSKLGLDPAKFRIVSVALAWEGKEPRASWVFSSPNERELMAQLNQRIRDLKGRAALQWCGHNIASFDLPRLQIAMARSLGYAGFFAELPKPWDIWDTCPPTGRVSLDALAWEVLPDYHLRRKTGLGKNMEAAVREGRWQEISEYCRLDAELARDVALRMRQ